MEGAALDRGREFFQQIKKNPRDLELRAVYADWLEEYGDGDLDMRTAAEQRAWTLEKQDAKERLELFAKAIGSSYPALMASLRTFLALNTTIRVSEQNINFSSLGWTSKSEANWAEWWRCTINQMWADCFLLTGEDVHKLWLPDGTLPSPLPDFSPFSFRTDT